MTEKLSEKELKEKLLQEKRERRLLERLSIYRERTFRESTMKIKIQGGDFYSNHLKGVPKKFSEESVKETNKKPRKYKKSEVKTQTPSSKKKDNISGKKSIISDIISKDKIIDLNSKNIEIEEQPIANRCFVDNEFEKNNSDINNNNNNNYGNNMIQPVSLEYLENNFQIDGENSLISNKKNKKMNNENKDDSNDMSIQIPMNNINQVINNSSEDLKDKNTKTSEGYYKTKTYEELKKNYPNEIEFYEKQKNYNNNGNVCYNTTLNTKTFINCDLRFFNLDLIVNRVGYFDVLYIDPPWRIKGGQRNDWSFMFSNSKFNLEYNTLSNNDILSLPLEKLSKKGFCFLWVLNSLLNVGYECLNKWGYDVVDQITWVKTRNGKVYVSQGYYFLHSSETCLVGYKCPINEQVEYKSKISSNIIFANVKGKSQKPHEMYEIIEKMMPGSKKIELFARNNNLREGWLSVGNQLGENYQQWKNILTCDICNKLISVGIKRYKSKKKANFDICEVCYNNSVKSKGNSNEKLKEHSETDFFEFINNIDEDILHHYFSCNNCNSEPIWGNRFHCLECDNFDLCEACFDKELASENNVHLKSHGFSNIEIPLLANGMDVHDNYRCKFCFQKPIVGTCFICMDCKNYYVCQNCYFNSVFIDEKHFGKNADHKFTLATKSKNKLSKYVKCFGCLKEPIENVRYKCNNCFDFNLCEDCYLKRNTTNFIYSTNHKNYHNFTSFYL